MDVTGGSNKEVLTDLGAFNATSPISTTTTYNTSNFALSQFPGAAMANFLEVQYYVVDSTANTLWTSGPTTGGQKSMYMQADNANSNMWSVNYNVAGSSQTVVQGQTSSLNTFYALMEQSGLGRGTMDGFINPSTGLATLNSSGGTTLAALATGGSVSQYLYFYSNSPDGAVQSGLPVAMITTNANGSTTVGAPSAVPVPAAIWLLGSGLISLVGIRRRTTEV